MSAQALHALTFPLDGTRLIEASAGTGKTYTIANLYLRLLLGHGRDQALGVDQILVVTFTIAATEELRDRVRERIATALVDFQAGSSSDEFIGGLIAQCPGIQAACVQLDAARRQMDEAAIYTIHGFCQRALSDNAFESGMGFEFDMVLDESLQLRQAAEDFWRTDIATLDADSLALAPAWSSPEQLLRELRSYLGSQPMVVEPPSEWDADLIALLRPRVDQLKQAWLQEDISGLLLGTPFKGNSRYVKGTRIAAMDAFCRSDALVFRYGQEESWEQWHPDLLLDAMPVAKKDEAPKHPLFEECAELSQLFAVAKQQLELHLSHRGIAQIRQSMAAQKAELQQLSPDDLLLQLNQALQRPAQGGALARLIAKAWPVVLVDEFQDTDGLQYAIFDAVYGCHSAAAWIMIGDPKQAIYKFRGADIFTYIGARRRVVAQGESLFTLGDNWRSSSAMVAAVNGLFERADSLYAQSGAFLYRDDIPFTPVAAAGSADAAPMLRDGEAVVPLRWFYGCGDEKTGGLSGGDARQRMASKAAMEIVELLNASHDGAVTLDGKALSPANIAVLVRERAEAAAVKSALAERGVNSVFLSRESVFDSAVAQDLYHVLEAVLHHADERKLRAALATGLVAAPMAYIASLEQDLGVLQQVLGEFARYHEHWRRHGVLSMLRELLKQRDIPAALLNGLEGERRLTDLRHLGELLQQASDERSGMRELLRWYKDQLTTDMPQDGESLRVRLESDRQLVQIVTIHASKGLEFDVVFVPLASFARRGDECIYHRQLADGFETVADLAPGETVIALAERERLAEDMRLLYVALTRARHQCCVGVANVKPRAAVLGFADTAVAHLLGLGPESGVDVDESAIITALQQCCAKLGPGRATLELVEEADVLDCTPLRYLDSDAPGLKQALQPTIAWDDWTLTSYTALARGASLPGLLGGAADEVEQIALDPPADEYSAFSFPRGARYGTLLHTILERIAFDGDSTGIHAVVVRELQAFGLPVDQWAGPVTRWMQAVLASSLPPHTKLRLNALPAAGRLSEMEFNFSLKNAVRAPHLDQMLRQNGYGIDGAPLAFADVSGVMRGFIDLVFEHKGRYFVLDYKSNYLGPSATYYDQAAMSHGISNHRYDLQLLIYSLALHRFLAGRRQDYDYERDFGGAYYLFLRGMEPCSDEGHGVYFHRPSQVLIEALDQYFGSEVLP